MFNYLKLFIMFKTYKNLNKVVNFKKSTFISKDFVFKTKKLKVNLNFKVVFMS